MKDLFKKERVSKGRKGLEGEAIKRKVKEDKEVEVKRRKR